MSGFHSGRRRRSGVSFGAAVGPRVGAASGRVDVYLSPSRGRALTACAYAPIAGYGAGRDGHDREILCIHQERSIDQSDVAPTAGWHRLAAGCVFLCDPEF